MNEARLAEAIEAEVAGLRAQGRIPTEITLGDEAWNALRRRLTFAAFGDRRAVQFGGLPCALAYGISDPRGFRVAFVEPRE